MSFTATIAGTDVTRALTAPPTITDQINANCCTLQFSVQQQKNPQNLIGKPVEILKDGECWFYGKIRKQDIAQLINDQTTNKKKHGRR